MDNFNTLTKFRLDKRNRKRTEKEKQAMRLGIDNFRSFLKSFEKERGIQPLCRGCARSCKVLNGANSKFECFDFVELK